MSAAPPQDQTDPAIQAAVAVAALDPARDPVIIAREFGLTPETVEAWRDRLLAKAPTLFLPAPAAADIPAETRKLRQEIRLLRRREADRFRELAAVTRIAEGRALRGGPGRAAKAVLAFLPRWPQTRAAILRWLPTRVKTALRRLLR